METPEKTIRVAMIDLEDAFASRDHVFEHYLDTVSGEVLAVPGFAYDGDVHEEMDAAVETIETDPARFLRLESDSDLRPSVDDARAFVREVEDEDFRFALEDALRQPRGWFRRFRDVLDQESGEVERWYHFARGRLQENIAAWLAEQGIRIVYEPLPPWQPREDVRGHLLAGAARFVNRVKQIRGVTRIALIGSMTTPKRAPNDVDFLLTIATPAIVPEIAAAARKLLGHAQQRNRGADVFLSDSAGRYLGRTCHWRECGPGIRSSCRAQHCGGHLNDDLHVIRLSAETIASPPLELWPQLVVRADVPQDVRETFGIR